jgi:hypothetical protein
LRELESESGRAAIRKDIDVIGNEMDELLVELREIDAEPGKREITEDDPETIRVNARQAGRKLAVKPTWRPSVNPFC